MWVVFLLSSMAFAIVLMISMYLGNKIINAIKRDNYELEQELEKFNENKINEKENKE